MIGCRFLFSSCRIDRVLRFTNSYVPSSNPNSPFYFQGQRDYHCLSCNFVMGGRKKKVCLEDHSKKHKVMNSIWRPVATRASSCEESLIKDETNELKDGSEVREVGCSRSSTISNVMKVATEAMYENTESPTSSSPLQDNVKNNVVEGGSSLSTGKHSISVEVGASLFRFIKGKGGSTQKRIEEETGVKIILPSSKEEDFVTIEGNSVDNVTSASEKIQAIIDEVVNSRSLDYSHFISLPLAIHPELVNKLINFQNSILGIGNSCTDENLDTDSTEDGDSSDSKEVDQLSKENADVTVELKVDDRSESVKVNFTNIPLVSYVPKASKSSASSDLVIDRSIFIKPKTFHLTVLMLKLWNKDRVKTATEVLQSISSKVLEALDNRPLSIRLKGLDCMKGSLAKARVLYAPVEEIGSEGRLLRACQIIIDAYVDAGLVLEGDAKQRLKLHATVMNARHRKRGKWTKKSSDSFDARGIFKRYGSEDWGQYLIREAHLSQRFSFDEHGYYHCCASIPFPENMQVE
ncbi:putative K domain, cyclic phosphodiesterase [Lupinus albus]|uniref:Putative K domain, cyclic phosphodiesterase n=1 Tax=Lupinus albus TaxID=3870 RepID=A0A6A4NEJ4_LUPAL|nr:putative K domain, cyclic phosphodiesterase [Lupinus albus]